MNSEPLPSKAHRLFFIKSTSRSPFAFHANESWDGVLNEPHGEAFTRFIDAGLIVPETDYRAIQATYTVDQLKDLLRARGLRLSGKKDDLLNRMREADPVWWEGAARSVPYFVRTREGQRIADTIYMEIGNESASMEIAVMDLIVEGRYSEACEARNEWSRQQVFGGPTNSCDEFQEIAEFVMARLERGDAIRALVNHVIGRANYEEKARSVFTAWYFQRDLIKFRQSSYIKGLRIIAPNDGFCGKAASHAANYRLRDAPSFPFKDCDRDGGCVCRWEPIFETESAGLVWRMSKERHPMSGGPLPRNDPPSTKASIRALGNMLGATEEDIQVAINKAGLDAPPEAPKEEVARGMFARILAAFGFK